MKYQPGQSGNPGGRPKHTAEVLEWRGRCRDFMQRRGWDALEEMANNKTSRDRFRSIELMAYGYGRPTLPISGDAEPEPAPPPTTAPLSTTAPTASSSCSSDSSAP
jgi:hypothetical protein